MKDLEDIINEINDAEKIAKKETKFIYDFCLSIVVNQQDRDFLNMSDSQAKQLVGWLKEHVIPIYEEDADYEKCHKAKSVIDKIKHLKKIS